jgi:hypothetical protein
MTWCTVLPLSSVILELFEIVTISSRGFATLLLRSRESPFWYSGAHRRARLGQLLPRTLLTSVFQFFGLIYPRVFFRSGVLPATGKQNSLPSPSSRPRHPLPSRHLPSRHPLPSRQLLVEWPWTSLLLALCPQALRQPIASPCSVC